jgi:hypothetical protein
MQPGEIIKSLRQTVGTSLFENCAKDLGERKFKLGLIVAFGFTLYEVESIATAL